MRRWLRFSLRGMLVLVFALAIPLAWLGALINVSQRETAFAMAVGKAGGQARFDYNAYAASCISTEPKGPWLMRAVFGDNIFSRISSVDLSGVRDTSTIARGLGQLTQLDTLSLPAGPQGDQLIDSVAQLPHLYQLTLDCSEITPQQMRRLLSCESLLYLELRGAAAADEVLAELPHAVQMARVTIVSGPTTDQGMKSLSEIKTIRFLQIVEAPSITNRGFRQLTNAPALGMVTIHGTQITEECVCEFKQMPKLETLAITPGTLQLRYKPIAAYRLDTGEAVPTPLRRFDCWPSPPVTGLVRCVDVEPNRIRLERWDVPTNKTDE
ncbi:leucine-rich repeat domain-containing protein [Blastopirellula retiformator]|nr:hypothetical protein [Blastopirellula retiformator]